VDSGYDFEVVGCFMPTKVIDGSFFSSSGFMHLGDGVGICPVTVITKG
jgi:hypothetical protein